MIVKKCKVPKVTSKSKTILTMIIINSEATQVDSFLYLGSKEGGNTTDIRKRMTMADASFRKLDNIWKAMIISRKTKDSLFKPSPVFVAV